MEQSQQYRQQSKPTSATRQAAVPSRSFDTTNNTDANLLSDAQASSRYSERHARNALLPPSGASPMKMSPNKFARVNKMATTGVKATQGGLGGFQQLSVTPLPEQTPQAQTSNALNVQGFTQQMAASQVQFNPLHSQQRPPIGMQNARLHSPGPALQQSNRHVQLMNQTHGTNSLENTKRTLQVDSSRAQRGNLIIQSRNGAPLAFVHKESQQATPQQTGRPGSSSLNRQSVSGSGVVAGLAQGSPMARAGTLAASGSHGGIAGQSPTRLAGASIVTNSQGLLPVTNATPNNAVNRTARADSCDQTINNTHYSINNVLLESNRTTKSHAPSVHAYGGDGRFGGVTQAVDTSNQWARKGTFDHGMKSTSSVHDSRGGILSKTGQLAFTQIRPESRGATDSQAAASDRDRERRDFAEDIACRPTLQQQFAQLDNLFEMGSNASGDEEQVDNFKKERALDYILQEKQGVEHAEAPAATSILNDIIYREKMKSESNEPDNEATAAPKLGGKTAQVASGVGQPSPTKKSIPKAPPKETQKDEQPFDFKFIKIIIKRSSSEREAKEVLLERSWVQKNDNIPHFANVIKGVDANEGVEITMNCNKKAFEWIIEFVRIKTDGEEELEKAKEEAQRCLSPQEQHAILEATEDKMYSKMDGINVENCLNVLVTSYFLQLFWVYEKVWQVYFQHHFAEVINNCSISLSNINPVIVRHVAERIPETCMEQLKEDRKDKFISNVYKAKIDAEILVVSGPESTTQIRQSELQRETYLTGPFYPTSTKMKNRPKPLKFAEVKEARRHANELFWCARCQRLITRKQAATISCVKPDGAEDNGKQVPSKTSKIKRCFKPFFQVGDEDKRERTVEEIFNGEGASDDEEPEYELQGQSQMVMYHGTRFWHHDVLFAEDMPDILRYYANLSKEEQRQSFTLAEPLKISSFIKFFRERYRLCWKEIYLKFRALIYEPETCVRCRELFQISEIAGCPKTAFPNPIADQPGQPAFIEGFHNLDFQDNLLDTPNGFTKDSFDTFKKEIQVIDNMQPLPINTTPAAKKSDQKKGRVDFLMDHYNKLDEVIGFIEPQSMNFETKLSTAYKDFIKRESKDKDKKVTKVAVQDLDTKVKPTVLMLVEIYNKAGEKVELEQGEHEDVLFSLPKAQKKLEKKFKDKKFMGNLQRECELYVKDNADHFPSNANQPRGAKFDYVENTIVECKKPGKEGTLDSVQKAAAQDLVIKRFRRIKKEILRDDDEYSMEALAKQMTRLRVDTDADDVADPSKKLKAQDSKKGVSNAATSLQKGSNVGGARNMNFILGRNKSPTAPEAAKDVPNTCDLAAQQGVKIYSDLKQITVKKAATKKATNAAAPVSGAAARKNFIQRNMTRSVGNRSGSNNPGTATVHPGLATTAPPEIRQNHGGIRNNSSQPTTNHPSSRGGDGRQQSAAYQSQMNFNTPGPSASGKRQTYSQHNSATRIQGQLKPINMSLENAFLKFPNGSQPQFETTQQTGDRGGSAEPFRRVDHNGGPISDFQHLQFNNNNGQINVRRNYRSPVAPQRASGGHTIASQRGSQVMAAPPQQQQLYLALPQGAQAVSQSQDNLNVHNNFSPNVPLSQSQHQPSRSGSQNPGTAIQGSSFQSLGGLPVQSAHQPAHSMVIGGNSLNSVLTTQSMSNGGQIQAAIGRSPVLKIRSSKIDKSLVAPKFGQPS